MDVATLEFQGLLMALLFMATAGAMKAGNTFSKALRCGTNLSRAWGAKPWTSPVNRLVMVPVIYVVAMPGKTQSA